MVIWLHVIIFLTKCLLQNVLLKMSLRFSIFTAGKHALHRAVILEPSSRFMLIFELGRQNLQEIIFSGIKTVRSWPQSLSCSAIFGQINRRSL